METDITKKKKWRYFWLLLMIMVLLTSFRMLWVMYHTPSEQPLAEDGWLDLRGYHLDKEPIALNGGWSFYPDRIIEPQQLHASEMTKQTNEGRSPQFGTYHLTIRLDERRDSSEVYAINIPNTNTASKLYINGDLKGESGNVSQDPTEHKGKGNPYTALFTTEKNEIEMILQISNFDTSKEIAIKNPIKFGTSAAIEKEQNFAEALLIGMVVILLLHSLYSILLYIFIHRTKLMLFFAVGFLLPAIDEWITYNSAALEWLHLNYEWSFKLKELIYLGAAFFLVQIMRVLLTKFEMYRRFRVFSILYATGTVLIILLPLSFLIKINVVFFILYIISFLSVISLALKEYFRYKEESIFIALVVISTTSGMLWGLIKSVSGLVIPFYPFDYLCAFLAFAVFWFKRFYRQNKQVVQLVDELKQADKLKDDFLSNSVNKLWSPLNKMTTIAQTLYNQGQIVMTNKNRSDLNYLINIGRSMSFVLNDLLDFTRLKENMVKVYPKSISMHSVMPVVFNLVKYLADGKQIKLTSKLSADFPHVFADESRLIQIFLNLLTNAVKFTDAGEVVVYGDVQDDMAIIYVQDTGIGMDEETKKNVMSAYEQGIKDEEGWGLGLTVSEKLIALHGGSLRIESEIGKGTKFIISLPLASEQNERNEIEVFKNENLYSEEGEQQADQNKSHILAVDDNPSNLRMVASIFSPELYQVVTVTNGEEALARLNEEDWDLLIVDTLMPHMSGYELTELVRNRYSLLDLPILLLTVRTDHADVNVGFRIGANDYVAKPINSLELRYRSDALIHLKKSINEKNYMEAAWLQAQIRPHFIFNTLNTIASLSTKDLDRMITLLRKFGEYLSMSFKEENLQRVISIRNELKLVKTYLYIESERFGDRIQVKWEVEEDIDVLIPPLSIQTLVENAIHHGLLKKESGGTICIRVTKDERFTKIAIMDDGIGMDHQQISKIFDGDRIGKGIGLYNTNRRLEKINGTGLVIQSSLNKGTIVHFKIPRTQN